MNSCLTKTAWPLKPMSQRARLVWLSGLSSFLCLGPGGPQPTSAADKPVNVYLFWTIGCPHCLHEKEFLAALERRIRLSRWFALEVSASRENLALFQRSGNYCKPIFPGCRLPSSAINTSSAGTMKPPPAGPWRPPSMMRGVGGRPTWWPGFWPHRLNPAWRREKTGGPRDSDPAGLWPGQPQVSVPGRHHRHHRSAGRLQPLRHVGADLSHQPAAGHGRPEENVGPGERLYHRLGAVYFCS